MIDTEKFKEVVNSFNSKLAAVSESITDIKLSEDKWSLKEIIGHLIDSASNNHQRFVRLQFGDLVHFPAYDAEPWINAQSYSSVPWKDIIALWYSYNCVLLNIIDTMDEKAVDNAWKIDESELSLGFLVKDYYRHLKWHTDQFESRLEEIKECIRDSAYESDIMGCENYDELDAKDTENIGLKVTLAWLNQLLDNIGELPDESRAVTIKRCCTAHYNALNMDEIIGKYAGDINGFIKFLESEWNWKVRVNEETKTIYADENKSCCVCPVVELSKTDSSVMCSCSEGFAEIMFSKVLQQDVSAKVIKSVLRGDSSCLYEIRW